MRSKAHARLCSRSQPFNARELKRRVKDFLRVKIVGARIDVIQLTGDGFARVVWTKCTQKQVFACGSEYITLSDLYSADEAMPLVKLKITIA